jgi:hypothetical protein
VKVFRTFRSKITGKASVSIHGCTLALTFLTGQIGILKTKMKNLGNTVPLSMTISSKNVINLP